MKKLKNAFWLIVIFFIGIIFLRLLPLVKNDMVKLIFPIVVNQILPLFYLFKPLPSVGKRKQTDEDKALGDFFKWIFNTLYLSALLSIYIHDRLPNIIAYIESFSLTRFIFINLTWFDDNSEVLLLFVIIFSVLELGYLGVVEKLAPRKIKKRTAPKYKKRKRR